MMGVAWIILIVVSLCTVFWCVLSAVEQHTATNRFIRAMERQHEHERQAILMLKALKSVSKPHEQREREGA